MRLYEGGFAQLIALVSVGMGQPAVGRIVDSYILLRMKKRLSRSAASNDNTKYKIPLFGVKVNTIWGMHDKIAKFLTTSPHHVSLSF